MQSVNFKLLCSLCKNIIIFKIGQHNFLVLNKTRILLGYGKIFLFLTSFIVYEARVRYNFKLFWDSVPLFYPSVPLLKEILKKGKDRNKLSECLKYDVLVSRGRLELPTSGLWDQRSNQLSYRDVKVHNYIQRLLIYW